MPRSAASRTKTEFFGFGARMRGTGVFADLIAKRFRLAAKRLGLSGETKLDCSRFRPPELPGQQLSLL